MKPNLFIVGAPKSGTTALYHYLAGHRRIFMSPAKEPHYFATDLKRGISDEQEYLALFDSAKSTHDVAGEASVWYLYSEKAIENIHQFNPGAKLIAMLRNPVDLVYSKHAQLVYNYEEDEPDFEKAWRLQDRRRLGEALPKYVVNPEFLFYSDIGKLGSQVERMLSVFPREQVKIIMYDDFRSDTAGIFRDTLSFLGLPDEGRTDFPKVNQNCVHRSAALGRLIRKPPRFMEKNIHALERFMRLKQFWGIDAITRMNTKRKKRVELSRSFRAELQEEFRPDIEALSGMMDRNLDHWLA